MSVTKFLGHHYAIWASDSNFLLISGTERYSANLKSDRTMLSDAYFVMDRLCQSKRR